MTTKNSPTSDLCLQNVAPILLPRFITLENKKQCLAAFLRIPAEVAMVQAAEKLFYHSRPSHVAPLHPPRGPSAAAADNSLSLSEGDTGRSSPGSSRSKRRPAAASGMGAGGVGRKGGPVVEEAEGLSAMREKGGGVCVCVGGGGGAGERSRRGGRTSSSSDRAGSLENDERCGQGVDSGRVAAGGALSRGDVEYTATSLRLRRARG